MGTVANFIKTIKNSDQAVSIIKDTGEVAIDAFLKGKYEIDGVLKDIPILNIAVNLYQMGNKVSAYFFAKNMLAFLEEIDRVPNHKRIEFLDKNCANDEGIENVGELALMILDKLDHPKLATMLGRAFSLMTLGSLTKKEFDIYSHVIKAMNPYIQDQLCRFYEANGSTWIDAGAGLILASYGLIKLNYDVYTIDTQDTVTSSIEMNDFGEKFYRRIILGSDIY